ncbi:MAG: type II toxin-antitoxin system Phd/YefM family antitoxin [Oceanipulchritudo sp.]
MKVITMHEAKTQLSRYVDAALAGREVVIGRRNKPLVRLVPLEEKEVKRRRVGALPELVTKMGTSFDEPVEVDMERDPLFD